ncbi:MAG TPA: glutathione S-transferase family protein [Gammaproteobacteria bacterium]|nr:glutathione S-transferase family protein [Gammaproteobacteria bacterium]
MLTLYHAPRSRSSRFIWLLEELGVPYDIERVSIRRGDGSGAVDPKDPHPHGKVPVIVHDDTAVFESSAIALYLTDAFPDRGIGPRVGDPQRGAYVTWLAYYAGVLEPAFLSKLMKIDVPRGTAGWVSTDEAMAYITGALASGPFLLGNRFSAADVLYGSTFALFLGNPLLPESEILRSYVTRCTARPAYAAAAAKDG